MSASSLHRESTDSLISLVVYIAFLEDIMTIHAIGNPDINTKHFRERGKEEEKCGVICAHTDTGTGGKRREGRR